MYFRVFLEVLTQILNDLFKGYLQNAGLNCFSAESWRHLLALSGPAYILCPIEVCVKDIVVDMWGKLILICL